MGDILRFFKDNEVIIYLILGLFGVWQLRQFGISWKELRISAFGLERQSAQARLNRVTYLLVIIFLLGIAEFVLVSFVVPAVPTASPLITPTLNLLATPTPRIDNESPPINESIISLDEIDNNNCNPDTADIVKPEDGETIRDIVEIIGTANIENFGFYKFEMAAINDASWLTIQAGDTITVNGKLGFWDTTRLVPGDYGLRLVVTDNQGNPENTCTIMVRVDPPTEPE
jgi:hypothetical protein